MRRDITGIADTPVTAGTIVYPERDGKPMGETDTHRDQIVDLIYCLREWFRTDPDVYVSGSLLLYYEEGNPLASAAPDVFVARGVDDHPRRTYKVWEEGKGPDLVIEITSKSSRLEDLGYKRALYAELEVREYFMFDPLGEWLTPPFAAYRLADGEYVRVEAPSGRVSSEVAGLEFGVVEGSLRVFDPATGKMLLTPSEESRARVAAERELDRLRRQLGPRHGDGER